MSCDTKGFEELMRNLENEQNRIDDFCKDCSIRIVSEVFKRRQNEVLLIQVL